jgi:hypothetical protein
VVERVTAAVPFHALKLLTNFDSTMTLPAFTADDSNKDDESNVGDICTTLDRIRREHAKRRAASSESLSSGDDPEKEPPCSQIQQGSCWIPHWNRKLGRFHLHPFRN